MKKLIFLTLCTACLSSLLNAQKDPGVWIDSEKDLNSLALSKDPLIKSKQVKEICDPTCLHNGGYGYTAVTSEKNTLKCYCNRAKSDILTPLRNRR